MNVGVNGLLSGHVRYKEFCDSVVYEVSPQSRVYIGIISTRMQLEW